MRPWFRLASAFLSAQAIGALSIIDRLMYGTWSGKSGDKLTQLLNLLTILTSLALVARGRHQLASVRVSAIVSISVCGFALITSVWSTDPPLTLRQGTQYLFLVVSAIGMATNLECNEIMDVLARVCFWSAVISLVLGFAMPGYTRTDDELYGIFTQKNLLGQAMALGAIACLHGFRARNCGRLHTSAMLVIISAAAFASRSTTSCLVIFVLCAADVLISLAMRGGPLRAVAIAAAALLLPCIVVLAVFQDSLFEMLGKDPTLTGRTDVWAYVITCIYLKPWLGWGYAAFWVPSNPFAVELSDRLGWWVPQAHNGLLEGLLCLGVIGTAGFIFLLIWFIRLAARCLRTRGKVIGISCLFCCLGIIITGITEAVPIFCGSWSIGLFITGLSCERALYAVRAQRYLRARKVAFQIPANT